MRPTICIDLDGTLAKYDKWKGLDDIGEPIDGAVEFVNGLAEWANIIIFTVRCSTEHYPNQANYMLVNRVKIWLDKYGFKYDHVWWEAGKPSADAYVDDRSVSCRPREDRNAYRKAMLDINFLCKRSYNNDTTKDN